MILAAGALLVAVRVSSANTESPSSSAASTAIEQGRHIVESVAMCVDCHSPRLPTGMFDPARSLQGSLLGFQPRMEMPWAAAAPGIAGLPGFDDQVVLHLLTRGMRPDGSMPRPPMPNYRMTETEARAVMAYLRSLPSGAENPASVAALK